MTEKIVEDGPNIAHLETSRDRSPKISNIEAVQSGLRDRGYEPIVIVETTDREEARIVSNDRYEEYHHDFPWIPDRRVPLMIIDGEVELYELEGAEARNRDNDAEPATGAGEEGGE